MWILEGFMERQRYLQYLVSEKAKHTRAVDIGKKECIRCGYCCLQRPCIPTPTEFEVIAKFLGLTLSDTLKKFFVIDALESGGTKFVFPAKDTQLDITGQYVPWRRTYDEGYCIFYDKKEHKCKIWPVRPETARVQNCWDKRSDEEIDKTIEQTLKAWENFDFSKLGIDIEDLEDYDDY